MLLLLKKKLTGRSLEGLLVIKKPVSALTGSLKDSAKSWLVDSGASKHMTGNKDVLADFKQVKFSS